MNNRERNWYEGKHSSHPPNCMCVECVKRRLIRERKRGSVEKKMRERAKVKAAIIKSIKVTFIVAVCVVIWLSFLGAEPLSGWKDAIVNKMYEGWVFMLGDNAGPSEGVEEAPTPDIVEVPTPNAEFGVIQEVAELIYNSVNDERVGFGIQPLEWDEQLEELAIEHSTNMALDDYFGHERLGWRGFSFGMSSGTVRGENLVLIPTRRYIPGRLLEYNEIVDWAIESWLDSTEHKANMFTSFSYTGVGVYATADYYYVTQIFEGQVPYAVPTFPK